MFFLHSVEINTFVGVYVQDEHELESPFLTISSCTYLLSMRKLRSIILCFIVFSIFCISLLIILGRAISKNKQHTSTKVSLKNKILKYQTLLNNKVNTKGVCCPLYEINTLEFQSIFLLDLANKCQRGTDDLLSISHLQPVKNLIFWGDTPNTLMEKRKHLKHFFSKSLLFWKAHASSSNTWTWTYVHFLDKWCSFKNTIRTLIVALFFSSESSWKDQNNTLCEHTLKNSESKF